MLQRRSSTTSTFAESFVIAAFAVSAETSLPVAKSGFAADVQAALPAAALGAVLVCIIGVPLARMLNIWQDEAFTMHTTGSGPLFAWVQAGDFEAQPPLYFVLLSLWRMLDESSITYARLPSVLFAAIATVLVVLSIYRIARSRPILVALVCALNPFVIWAAVEMRCSALVLLAGAALTWTFFEGFICSVPSRAARILYCAAAIVGLYTQYYFAFVLLAHLITVAVLRRHGLKAMLTILALTACAFFPCVGAVLSHLHASGDFVTDTPALIVLRNVAASVFSLVAPHHLSLTEDGRNLLMLLLIALLCIAIAVGHPRMALDTHSRAMAFQWVACIGVFVIALSILGEPPDLPRHLVSLAPSSILMGFFCLASFRRHRAILNAAAISLLAVLAATQYWAEYRPPLVKLGAWSLVATSIDAERLPAPIAVFPAEIAVPLRYYLRSTPIAIPRPMPYHLDYIRATTLSDERQVSVVLDPVYARSSRLWLVTSEPCSVHHSRLSDYHCNYLEDYMRRHYRVIKYISYHGALLRLYTRRSNMSNRFVIKKRDTPRRLAVSHAGRALMTQHAQVNNAIRGMTRSVRRVAVAGSRAYWRPTG